MAAEGRDHPREVVLRACAGHGQDTVIDWCIDFLTGEISGEDAYGADLPKLAAITGSAHPGGWSEPVDPVNYYWIRVWAARVFLYVWRDDVVDALLVAVKDPAWRVREHVARITAKHELGQLADALVPDLSHELPRVRAAAARAIGAAGEAEHAESLQDLVDDPDPAVRAAAEAALARLEKRLDRRFERRT
ncbi:HEAT repeat domain-containing protein [Kribbella sp. NPDC049227]|uniref:HEAT repeat domain-containing protein n=1 Tax=Kribbella sp. NPDC049227 TaxID=3364113 RepID=UPI003716A9F5